MSRSIVPTSHSYMLSLVATPIGNLSDFTIRAISTLNECDYILCEDTRHSFRLLSHYQIKKPCKSLHKFNEQSQIDNILHDLSQGMHIALISDAGTPGISDPGELLVQKILKSGYCVTQIPGPCAAIAALCASGLLTSKFQFCGFLPRKEGELKSALMEILDYDGTTICYESPKRLCKSLAQLTMLEETRQIVIARELTKIHEEYLRGTCKELLAKIKGKEIKGEMVLLISGRLKQSGAEWLELTPEEHVKMLENAYKLSHLDAIKMAAKLRGVPKRQIYQCTAIS